MLTRIFAITKILIQYLQAKHVFAGAKGSPQKSETMIIKDVISETTEAIELKLHKLYFKFALGLVAVGLLAYGVIRLIWYFENYLLLNYGQNSAVWFVAGLLAVTALGMVYGKFLMDKLSHEKKKLNQKNADREAALEAAEPGFFATPEKVLHQLFVGFLDGFHKPTRQSLQIENQASRTLTDVNHLRSASH